MSDESGDLEPIDVTAAPTRETPLHPTREMPASPPADASWPPGWYSDPWTAGQYRYWTGQAWTGETNRWGPTNVGRGADPWPALSAPVASGYGLPTPTAAQPATVPRSARRGPIIAGVIALILLLLVSAVVGYTIDSNSRSKSAVAVPGSATPTTGAPSGTTTPSGSGATSSDPDRNVLGGLVVHQADVGSQRTVVLYPNGNRTSEATLDLCNGTFPSERLRTARLQVVTLDAAGNAGLSTEGVLYRNPAAAAEAMTELRVVRAKCPHRAVKSPVKEPTAETVFNAAPDTTWPHTPTVDRQAYSFVTKAGGQSLPSTAVYLRRGRVLLGLYFQNPNAPQPPIAGKRSIKNIVAVFEARMAALPAGVVNRR